MRTKFGCVGKRRVGATRRVIGSNYCSNTTMIYTLKLYINQNLEVLFSSISILANRRNQFVAKNYDFVLSQSPIKAKLVRDITIVGSNVQSGLGGEKQTAVSPIASPLSRPASGRRDRRSGCRRGEVDKCHVTEYILVHD